MSVENVVVSVRAPVSTSLNARFLAMRLIGIFVLALHEEPYFRHSMIGSCEALHCDATRRDATRCDAMRRDATRCRQERRHVHL